MLRGPDWPLAAFPWEQEETAAAPAAAPAAAAVASASTSTAKDDDGDIAAGNETSEGDGVSVSTLKQRQESERAAMRNEWTAAHKDAAANIRVMCTRLVARQVFNLIKSDFFSASPDDIATRIRKATKQHTLGKLSADVAALQEQLRSRKTSLQRIDLYEMMRCQCKCRHGFDPTITHEELRDLLRKRWQSQSMQIWVRIDGTGVKDGKKLRFFVSGDGKSWRFKQTNNSGISVLPRLFDIIKMRRWADEQDKKSGTGRKTSEGRVWVDAVKSDQMFFKRENGYFTSREGVAIASGANARNARKKKARKGGDDEPSEVGAKTGADAQRRGSRSSNASTIVKDAQGIGDDSGVSILVQGNPSKRPATLLDDGSKGKKRQNKKAARRKQVLGDSDEESDVAVAAQPTKRVKGRRMDSEQEFSIDDGQDFNSDTNKNAVAAAVASPVKATNAEPTRRSGRLRKPPTHLDDFEMALPAEGGHVAVDEGKDGRQRRKRRETSPQHSEVLASQQPDSDFEDSADFDDLDDDDLPPYGDANHDCVVPGSVEGVLKNGHCAYAVLGNAVSKSAFEVRVIVYKILDPTNPRHRHFMAKIFPNGIEPQGEARENFARRCEKQYWLDNEVLDDGPAALGRKIAVLLQESKCQSFVPGCHGSQEQLCARKTSLQRNDLYETTRFQCNYADGVPRLCFHDAESWGQDILPRTAKAAERIEWDCDVDDEREEEQRYGTMKRAPLASFTASSSARPLRGAEPDRSDLVPYRNVANNNPLTHFLTLARQWHVFGGLRGCQSSP